MRINELETMLRAKGKDVQADMVRNIIPAGVECIFVRQAEQLGLGHAVLCAERAVGGDPFAVLLADDFLTDYESWCDCRSSASICTQWHITTFGDGGRWA